MIENTLEVWLSGRKPRVPEPFLPHLLELGDGPAHTAGLLRRGVETLDRALRDPGRNRESAFRLLSADAFLTYACEAAVQEEDAADSLKRVLDDLAEHFR